MTDTLFMKFSIITVLFLLTISSLTNADTGKPVLKLWYKQPAKEWMQATPVGNGRLGAMIFGGINNDRDCIERDNDVGGSA